MGEAFEQLVIQRLDSIDKGQVDLYKAFSAHKEAMNEKAEHAVAEATRIATEKFTALELKQAEDAGEAKAKAKTWGFAGSVISTFLIGGYETIKHFWK
jgi:hypothetical protein